jgi:hypothetical protein
MMNLIPKRSAATITAIIVGISLVAGISQKLVTAQAVATSNGQKVEDVFLNIKSLKGQPADMLNPTMVFFEASLGVGCPYCHDADATKRELDSKPQKLIARQMIEMVNSINQNTFRGARQVTCFTCHEGRSMPIGVPNVTGAELPKALGEDYIASLPPPAPVPPVSASQVIDKYIAALGGPTALSKVSSLTAVGTVTQRRPGRDYPANQIEISSKAPGMELISTRAGQNENLLAYGGNGGWARAGNTAPRELRKAEADGARLEDPFNLPLNLKQALLDPKMDHPDVIGSREVYVVTGHTQNLPLVKAYFEKENGMLTRLVYFTDTLFGQYPTQIDYGDFRDVGGRKVPYQWVISQTRNREYTYAMQAVRAAAIDDTKFVRPAAAAAR